MSRFYGERRFTDYAITRRLSLFTALFLSTVSIVIIFVARDNLGNLFGTSDEAALEIAIATPVFLVGMFFYAYSRICSSAFYSTERAPILRLHLCRTYHANRFTFDYSKILLTYRCMVLPQILTACISFYLSKKTHVKRDRSKEE